MKNIPDKSVGQKIELLKERKDELRKSLQENEEEKKEDLRRELQSLEERLRYLRQEDESQLETTTWNNNQNNQEEQPNITQNTPTNYTEESEDNEYGAEDKPSVSDPVKKLNKEIKEAFEKEVEGPKYKGPKY